MPETTIEFKITFDTATTSYYSMMDRLTKVLKDELRKAYYDCKSESSSESDAEESIFSRHETSSVSDIEEVEIELNEFNLNH